MSSVANWTLGFALAVCMACPTASPAAPAVPQAGSPPAAPRAIPAGTPVRIVHTIDGKDAVRQFTLAAGISIQSLRGPSGTNPFDRGSTDVSVAVTRVRTAPLDRQVFTTQDLVPPADGAEGDTVSYAWTSGCWRHSKTWAYVGGGWRETAHSATYLETPDCKVVGINS